jgi:hypothetical protein
MRKTDQKKPISMPLRKAERNSIHKELFHAIEHEIGKA